MASTTPSGFPNLPSWSVKTRNTVTSIPMGPDCTAGFKPADDQVALRSSEPIALSTATRVSAEPVTVRSPV